MASHYGSHECRHVMAIPRTPARDRSQALCKSLFSLRKDLYHQPVSWYNVLVRVESTPTAWSTSRPSYALSGTRTL